MSNAPVTSGKIMTAKLSLALATSVFLVTFNKQFWWLRERAQDRLQSPGVNRKGGHGGGQ